MSTVPAAYHPAPKQSTNPLVTYRVEIASTKAQLRIGLLGTCFRYGQNPSDPAEFSSIHQAAGVVVHAQRRLNQPFESAGAPPLAHLHIEKRDWSEADVADIYDAGIRIKRTAIEAALLDLEGAPPCLAAVRTAREERW